MSVKQSDNICLGLKYIAIQLLQQLPQKNFSNSQIFFVNFKLIQRETQALFYYPHHLHPCHPIHHNVLSYKF